MVAQQRKSVSNVDHPPQLLGGTAIKPPERHGWDVIKYIIYDPEKGEIFTRTPKSWFLIILFYCIYYTCLACFWYGMLQIFFQFMPYNQPKYILGESIIGTNPGVGMAPDQPDVTIDSSMLFLKWNANGETASNDLQSKSNIDWARRYQRIMDRYDNTNNTKVCDTDDYNDGKEACRFVPKAVLGACAEFPYGYQSADDQTQVQPCVILKVNRIYGWEPQEYEDADLEALPENVRKLVEQDRRKMYVDCTGNNPADKEALEGQLTYFPANQGISFKYFPYTQSHGVYHKPIIAVKFGSGIPRGQLIHVECKLYVKGVVHSTKERIGQVNFEYLLDDYDLTKKDD